MTFASHATDLVEFIDNSSDGYAIFSPDDVMLCCNQACCDFFALPDSELIGKSFDNIIRQVFRNQNGPKIDTLDIELWLKRAALVRRSKPFRLFETDRTDGRWFLVSEQLSSCGGILVHFKDMTKQKALEQELNHSTRRLTDLALTDELTGIANRRGLINSASERLGNDSTQSDGMALLLFDLDHFKAINDRYGHQVGDGVLRQVTQRVNLLLRAGDLFGRIGGEEFAIFLSAISAANAFDIAERIRLDIANRPIVDDISISLSIGLTHVTRRIAFDQLYCQTDKALYRAKASGRNRSVMDNELG